MPPNYDSMVGKVIAYGASREQAIRRMRIALSEMMVDGIKTNIKLTNVFFETLVRNGADGGVGCKYSSPRTNIKTIC